MLADAARMEDKKEDEEKDEDGNQIVRRELKTKEDIKNYIKGII